MSNNYIFKSKRLGFRNWLTSDLTAFATINANAAVMEHFPKTLTEKETEQFIQRLQIHYDKHGYNYFATEMLETGELIGFIGLAFQTYQTAFTPATDIGWRLKKTAWGKGYATEGAQQCLHYAFHHLKLEKVISTCTINNTRSENVMKKIGMTKMGYFNHPNLKDYPAYEQCVWYKISAKAYNLQDNSKI